MNTRRIVNVLNVECLSGIKYICIELSPHSYIETLGNLCAWRNRATLRPLSIIPHVGVYHI